MTLSVHDQRTIEAISANWRLTPATFLNKIMRGVWIPSPWLNYCAIRIATGIARGNARIIISAPPRHGKTQLVSIGTSAWLLENFPRRNIILAAYGAELAQQYGREVRDLIRDNKDLLNCRLDQSQTRQNAFLTETDGYMFSTGLGGTITGRGAHVLLIDDYIKEVKEALSLVSREYIWNWYVTTARTRLEPGASIIIIATRWHSDDLIGRLLKAQPEVWENIVFPAICTDEFHDLIGRKIGDPLFPERYGLDALAELRDTLGPTFFSALFQQKPLDEGKKISDGAWLKLCNFQPPYEEMRYIRTWDVASTEGGGDYTTGALCAYHRQTGFFFVINMIRKQLSPGQAEIQIRQTAVDDSPGIEIGIEQEPGSAGKALVEYYKNTVLPEFKVTPIAVVGQNSKLIRAQPLLAAAEGGKVYLMPALWNRDFVKEFDLFPAGPYDDQVDTVAAAYTLLSGKKVFSATWGHKDPNRNVNGGYFHKSVAKAAVFKASSGRGATWGR